ncbi:uncharacterized protein VTP21DRAFT_3200 [Calcarisporiella thermophila]|uniref:uncharacterized protein n=1 Tax=Calcarisporiella thermophila TaxID=911321 RepID=UPI003742F680
MGYNGIMGSRLIPRSTLESNASSEQLAKVMVDIRVRLLSEFLYTGALLGGGAVACYPESYNAVNPAWRKSLLHISVFTGWLENATLSERTGAEDLLTNLVQTLRDITPDSGSYPNESDPNEPNWQQAFFGNNYP